MTQQDPEHGIRELFRGVWNNEDTEIASDLVHEDYLIHDRDIANELRGPELYRTLAKETREIFPDANFTIEDIFSVEDRVAVRWVMVGTHEGVLYGIDPTGQEITLPAVEINRFQDGVLRETWAQSDIFGVITQLNENPSNIRDSNR